MEEKISTYIVQYSKYNCYNNSLSYCYSRDSSGYYECSSNQYFEKWVWVDTQYNCI